MIRFLSLACGTFLIGYLAGLTPSIGLTAAPDPNEEQSVVAHLFRRDYPEAHYASFALEVRSESETVVRGIFDLRQKTKKLASIPLSTTTQKNPKGGQTTFLRVNCIAVDEVSDTSFFYVFVSDPHTGKTINEIRVLLSSAQPVKKLPEG